MTEPSTAERALLLLHQWRQSLELSGRERSLLGGPLAGLDGQVRRLEQRRLRLAVPECDPRVDGEKRRERQRMLAEEIER